MRIIELNKFVVKCYEMNQRKFPKALRKDEDMEGSLSEEEDQHFSDFKEVI
jgi:hypothetical protein